jgi:hypothetical protein
MLSYNMDCYSQTDINWSSVPLVLLHCSKNKAVDIQRLIWQNSSDPPILLRYSYCHVLSDDRRILYWLQDILDTFTARDTLHRSLAHTDWCSQTSSFVTVSSGGRSSTSGLYSLQGGDRLTPTSYSDRWLRPVLPSADSSRAGLTSNEQSLDT